MLRSYESARLDAEKYSKTSSPWINKDFTSFRWYKSKRHNVTMLQRHEITIPRYQRYQDYNNVLAIEGGSIFSSVDGC